VRSKGTWYVSFEPKERLPGQRAFIRKTETFRNEQDAKAFAKAKLNRWFKHQRGHAQPSFAETDDNLEAIARLAQ
jgi:hypothetical protein